MFKSKRAIIMALTIVLSLSLSVYGTLAFLTDSSTVVNTFTVGNVDITVDETEVNPDGTAATPPEGSDEPNRVEENDYHLIPGHSYIKDPTMTVHAGSEDSYVRMKVTLSNLEELKAIPALGGENFELASLVEGLNEEIWVPVEPAVVDEEANTITFEFRYHEVVSMEGATEDLVLEPLFEQFVVPGEITGDQLATLSEMTMTINGHAIQAYSFDTADAAWAAFDAQMTTTTTAEDTTTTTEDTTTDDTTTTVGE